MEINFRKYHGAENDFIMLDDSAGKFQKFHEESPDKWRKLVNKMCNRRSGIGADGLILISPDEHGNESNFMMYYFNSDGSHGSLCGNGSRCSVLFAAELGLLNFGLDCQFTVVSPAGNMHLRGKIIKPEIDLESKNICSKDHVIAGQEYTVTISMPELKTGVKQINECEYFLDTGSPIHVRIIANEKTLNSLNVEEEGKRIRYSDLYKDVGVNVSFVAYDMKNKIAYIRTYERGVECETNASGCGAVAAVIVIIRHFGYQQTAEDLDKPDNLVDKNLADKTSHLTLSDTISKRDQLDEDSIDTRMLITCARVSKEVRAKGGALNVSLDLSCYGDGSYLYKNIELTGPATKVFSGVYYGSA